MLKWRTKFQNKYYILRLQKEKKYEKIFRLNGDGEEHVLAFVTTLSAPANPFWIFGAK